MIKFEWQDVECQFILLEFDSWNFIRHSFETSSFRSVPLRLCGEYLR
jgi:hypothetical protein